MKIVDLSQRSEAWFAWRRQGVTASVVAAVLGYDEHKTPWQAWAEYIGRAGLEEYYAYAEFWRGVEPADLSRNPHVIRGQRREDWVRQRFEARHDEVLLPFCVESTDNPIFRVSLDGLTTPGIPAELKAPALSTFLDILKYGRVSEAYLRYWPQVQMQIYATDADHGYLCFLCVEAGAGRDYIEFRIERDETFIREEMIPEVEAFWSLVQKRKEPPKDPCRDVFIPAVDDLGEWRQAVDAIRLIEAERERYKALLEQTDSTLKDKKQVLRSLMSDYRMAFAFDLQVTRFTRAGSIDYKQIVEERLQLSDSELEAYRRLPGNEQLKLTNKKPPKEVREEEARRRATWEQLIRNATNERVAVGFESW